MDCLVEKLHYITSNTFTSHAVWLSVALLLWYHYFQWWIKMTPIFFLYFPKYFSFKIEILWVFKLLRILPKQEKSKTTELKKCFKKECYQVLGKMSLLWDKTPLYCDFEKVRYSPSVLSTLRRKLHISFVLTWLNTILPAAPCSCFFALCLMTSTQSFKHTFTITHTNTHTARRAEQLK